jgi:hypothetical protein
MTDCSKLKVYFYCFPPTLNGQGDYRSGYHYYQHGTVCLGEGLKTLGVKIFSNVNFWLPSLDESFLFTYDPNVAPDDCDIVVINDLWWQKRSQFARELFDVERLLRASRPHLTVFLNLSDDAPNSNFLEPELSRFDHCFKSHLTKSSPLFPNTHPFPFGLSTRILKEVQNVPVFNQRKLGILVNSRSSLYGDHSLRRYIEEHFLPRIKSIIPLNTATIVDAHEQGTYHTFQWAQASGRHNPGYYKLLLSTTACSSFGGYFISPFPHHSWSLAGRFCRKAITKFGWKTNRLVQWDSWRFWEALAAGCVPIHLDFENYGFILPVMPENWKHYIGIDLDDLDSSIARIAQNLERLQEISEAGRSWALEHYSPVAVARRFLETVLLK